MIIANESSDVFTLLNRIVKKYISDSKFYFCTEIITHSNVELWPKNYKNFETYSYNRLKLTIYYAIEQQ